MRLLPKSRKRRIIKKWFKRTGKIRCVYIGKRDGLWWHVAEIPR